MVLPPGFPDGYGFVSGENESVKLQYKFIGNASPLPFPFPKRSPADLRFSTCPPSFQPQAVPVPVARAFGRSIGDALAQELEESESGSFDGSYALSKQYRRDTPRYLRRSKKIRRMFGNDDSDLESEDEEDDPRRSRRETSVVEESALEDLVPIGAGAESDAMDVDEEMDVVPESKDEMPVEPRIPAAAKGKGKAVEVVVLDDSSDEEAF